MLGAALALFADLGACHVQKSSVTICVLPAPFRWRATPLLPPISMRWIYFYPRPPCGGRRFHQCNRSAAGRISIHALRVEGDPSLSSNVSTISRFLSTPSGWRATIPLSSSPRDCPNFYPRPPGGGRQKPMCIAHGLWHFYPRPPGGGRPRRGVAIYSIGQFLSMPSGWRATVEQGGARSFQRHFYPRPPGGGRPRGSPEVPRKLNFYPRPPGGGRPPVVMLVSFMA